jgi:hypothetical protein
MSPLILNLGTRWRWLFRFAHRPSLLPENIHPRNPLCRPQSRSGQFYTKDKSLATTSNRTKISSHWGRSTVTVLTELPPSQLARYQCKIKVSVWHTEADERIPWTVLTGHRNTDIGHSMSKARSGGVFELISGLPLGRSYRGWCQKVYSKEVKVKVKFTLEQATKAHRWSRDIVLLFL